MWGVGGNESNGGEGRDGEKESHMPGARVAQRCGGWGGGGGGNESNGGEGRDREKESREKESHMPGARAAQICGGGGGGVMNLMEGRGEMGRKRVICLVQEQHRDVGGG